MLNYEKLSPNRSPKFSIVDNKTGIFVEFQSRQSMENHHGTKISKNNIVYHIFFRFCDSQDGFQYEF